MGHDGPKLEPGPIMGQDLGFPWAQACPGPIMGPHLGPPWGHDGPKLEPPIMGPDLGPPYGPTLGPPVGYDWPKLAQSQLRAHTWAFLGAQAVGILIRIDSLFDFWF